MKELRECLVSLQTSLTLAQLSDQDPPVRKTDDALQCQDDGVGPDTGTKEALSETTSDQEIKRCDLSVIDISTGCKGVRRCSTFPRNEGVATELKSVSRGKEPAVELPAYERSKSFPTCQKSALKGSRAQQPGASPRSTELHVKWAPDVYDPPVTSQSHTVQSHSGQKGGGGGSSSKGKKRTKKKDKRRKKG